MHTKLILACVSTLAIVSSCSTPKNITYFQDITNGGTVVPQQQFDIKVKPEDKLSIIVSTQDLALSNLFNLVQMQTRLGNATSAASSSNYNTNNDGRTSYYTVDSAGDINFPVIGKLHIGGMKRDEVANFIERQLIDRDLVQDPVVTVEFINTGISVIGEVTAPGRYEFNKDRITLLDALAMAKDININGVRDNVLVIRENADGSQQTYRVDMTDMASIASSPVFYLQQNDVVYVEPNNKRKRETTASGNSAYSPSFWVSVGSLGLTIATLITTLSK